MPKIQHRFLQQLEQHGVTAEVRVAALAMADKIRRYPLEAKHVMGSWERYTKTATEDFKTDRGAGDDHERHLAYAVVFWSVRDCPPAQSVGDLKQRIEVVSARTPQANNDRSRSADGGVRSRKRDLVEGHGLALDRQIEKGFRILRELSPEFRSGIEASARDRIINFEHARRAAREMLPDAILQLHDEPNERNAVQTLTMTLVAAAPEHRRLLREVDCLPYDDRKKVLTEARTRLESYTATETALRDVRRDAADAAIQFTLAPSAESFRAALVLAQAREESECVADPRRVAWQIVAAELTWALA